MNSISIEVARASQIWVEQFNAGNIDYCLSRYSNDALMVVGEDQEFRGTEQIAGFWRPFVESGAGELRYFDVEIQVVSESEAHLSANWSMNVGRGIITLERWMKTDNGEWILAEDRFAVQEQFDLDKAPVNKKTALIIVDLQQDYFAGGAMELENIDRASENAQKLLQSFREQQQPVFHVRHLFLNSSAPFFVPGSNGAKIHASVEPLDHESVIVKNQINSFQDTALESQLRTAEVEKVVIIGAMSHMCIEGTARAAKDLGFETVVVTDACATCAQSHDGETIPAQTVHNAAMASLGFAYAKLESTENYLAALHA